MSEKKEVEVETKYAEVEPSTFADKEVVKVQNFKKATLILKDPSGRENNLGSIKRLNSFVSVRTKVTQNSVTVTIMREADGAILTYVLPIAFELEETDND